MRLQFSISSIEDKLRPVFKKYGVTRAVLFGSYAKGCATPMSDVDIIVDTDLSGFKFMELYCAVQDALDGIALDMFARYELIPGGMADLDISQTGKEIYSV